MAATHEPASPPAPVGEPGSAPRRDLPSGAQLEGGEMGPASLSEWCRSPGAPRMPSVEALGHTSPHPHPLPASAPEPR